MKLDIRFKETHGTRMNKIGLMEFYEIVENAERDRPAEVSDKGMDYVKALFSIYGGGYTPASFSTTFGLNNEDAVSIFKCFARRGIARKGGIGYKLTDYGWMLSDSIARNLIGKEKEGVLILH